MKVFYLVLFVRIKQDPPVVFLVIVVLSVIVSSAQRFFLSAEDKRNNMVLHYENACHQHMMLLCSTLAVQYEQLRTQQRQLDALSVQCSALADASRER